MAKDYAAISKKIVENIGGVENIASVTHCMTRLRLVLRDSSKFDSDAVKQVPGVLNVIVQNGEHQVVIGQDVPDVYAEAIKIDGIKAGGTVEDSEAAAKDLAQDHGSIGNAILSFIGGWNSYFWPKMITTTDVRRTIAVGVTYLRQTFSGLETSNYNEIMAGAVMGIVPIILLFLILQKYIMTGMSKAAMK